MVDAKCIRHLITKVARHIWIIFDYGVPENDCKPPVAAFQVLDGSTFSTARFYHPGLEKEVNDIVDISLGRGAKFPARTDLRQN